MKDIIYLAAAKIQMADFNPTVKPDAPSVIKTPLQNVMGFLMYAGLTVMAAAIIGAGISFGLTHNREDASESVTKLIKPLVGVAIVSAAIGIIGFIAK